MASVSERNLAITDTQRQYQSASEYHWIAPGLAAVSGANWLPEWYPSLRILIYATGFGQTSGSVTSSFRQGYAAAASIVLFFLVLILGLAAQTVLQRREERILG
jgi:hypothetical protein